MGYFPVLNTKKGTSKTKMPKTKINTTSNDDGGVPKMNKPKMHGAKSHPLTKSEGSSIVKKMTMGKKGM